MWPWGHLASAYLLYAGILWVRHRDVPGEAAAITVGLGALAPDIVDKPLAWYVGVLPHGRSFSHSLLLGGTIVAIAAFVAHRRGYTAVAFAFATGYFAHIAADGLYPAIQGDFASLGYLGWPITSPPLGDAIGLLERLQRLEVTPVVGFELFLTVVSVALWWHHGRPGLGVLRRWIDRRTPSTT